MISFSDNFKDAVHDYRYLLERRYPRKTILKLIATRYSLSATERSILFRGISTKEKADECREKLIKSGTYNTDELHIDGFNVLITIIAYLNGTLVYLSDDGFLRDTAEVHGSKFNDELVERAFSILFMELKSMNFRNVFIYIDKQLGQSDLFEKYIRENGDEDFTRVSLIISESADRLLKDVDSGIIATSDSEIIEKTTVPVIDLPYLALERQFNPDFPDMKNLV